MHNLADVSIGRVQALQHGLRNAEARSVLRRSPMKHRRT